MAVRFNGNTANYLSRTSGTLLGIGESDVWTVMLWARWNGVSGWQNICYIGTGVLIAAAQINDNKLNLWATDGTDGTTSLSANTWYHITVVRSGYGANGFQAYLNGVLEINRASAGGGGVASNYIGSWEGGSDAPDARYAACKIWTVALTADEIASEMRVVRPVRTANLFGWYPMFGATGEQGRDYSGNGYDFTTVGTLTAEDGPPVSWGGALQYVQLVASAGPAAQNIGVGLVEAGQLSYAVAYAPGLLSLGAGQAVATIEGYAVSALPGAISIAVGQAAATIEGYAPTTARALTIGVGSAAATVAGYEVSAAPGAINASVGQAAAAIEGQAVSAAPGAISITVGQAEASTTANAVTAENVDTSQAVDVGLAVGAGDVYAVGYAPGAISTTVGLVEAGILGYAPSGSSDAQAVGVGSADANSDGYSLTAVPGTVTVSVGGVSASVEVFGIDTARALTIDVGGATAQIEGAVVTGSFGDTLATVGLAEAGVEGYAPDYLPGAIAIAVGQVEAQTAAYVITPGEPGVVGSVVIIDVPSGLAYVSDWPTSTVHIVDVMRDRVEVGGSNV